MGFLDRLVPLDAKGEKNFERAMRAELRRDFDKAESYFTACADALQELVEKKQKKRSQPLVRHLVMAGIACVRIGRNEQALDLLDQAIAMRDDVPDAWLHAGYACAKLGRAEQAAHYWQSYPQWSEDRIVAEALADTLLQWQSSGGADLDAACEAIARAYFSQMRHNHALPPQRRDAILGKRGY
jgi:tetratricopeptide (TPR) repeat protein